MVGPKGGLVRVPSDRPAPAGCKPLEVPMRTVAPASADPLATIVDATSARFAVAGTVHHATAEGLASLYVGAVLALEPVENPHDPYAVGVFLPEPDAPLIGYVPRVIAPQVRAACVAAAGRLYATVERLGIPGDVDRVVYVAARFATLTTPAPLGKVHPASSTPTPPAMLAPEEPMSTTPVELVPLTPEERKALAAMPGLVVQMMRALDAMTAGPAAAGTAPAAAVEPPTDHRNDLVPHPLNPSAAPIARHVAEDLVRQMDEARATIAARTAATAKPAPTPPASAAAAAATGTDPAAAKSVGEHLSTPVPTLDDLRAACGRAASRLGGNPAALARMATFGAKRVADVPEAKRALFVAYMDGDDAAKA